MNAMLLRTLTGCLVAGMAASTIVMTPAQSWAATEDVRALVATHRQAAADATQKAAYHDQMKAKAAKQPRAGKFNMVKHCERWARYYRGVAAKNSAAVTRLESVQE